MSRSSWVVAVLFWATFFTCIHAGAGAGVDGGDLSGDRQRNIFPLPQFSSDDQPGTWGTDWVSMVNRGINALNVLSGCVNSQFSRKKPTRVQRRALKHISDSYMDVCSIVDTDPGRSSLEELCSSSRLYQVDRSDVVSYARELVSWPKVETRPVPLGECLPCADVERLATWRQHMLKPAGSVGDENNIKRPYMDPILKHNHTEYMSFIQELQKRHMIAFKTDIDDAGDLGIFFVRKKNGSQRLIFDTRILNQKFVEPPSTDLPSADAFTRLEMPENESFYIGSGDLANAFYTLSVPDDLGRMFTLPAIKAEKIGLCEIGGAKLRPGQLVCPYLTVLPMGWSWALHLCQCVMMNAIHLAGFDSSHIISDKGDPVRIHEHGDTACGGYVDNFLVVGNDQAAVNAGLESISERLRSFGPTVHEEEPATHSISFVGLSFNGVTGCISLKPERIRKLQRAIHELLVRNFASGSLLEVILGHLTWAIMCRREGLSILKSCYAFVHENKENPCRLWPTVRAELETVSALLPLFRSKINIGWSEDVTASDSSPFGYGICCRKVERDIVQMIGGQCEKWRYRFEDAVDARKHAAKSVGIVDSACLSDDLKGAFKHGSLQYFDDGSCNDRFGFKEVPLKLLHPDDWVVAWSRPWKHEDNILHTEALALTWSVEHSLRANRNFGRKILCLADNLPLTLSACKGRGKSSYLTKPLRKLCALSLATGSRVHVRWIPSEWNVSDRPSRALSQWAARGFDSWFRYHEQEHPRPSRQHRVGASSVDPAKIQAVKKEGSETAINHEGNHSSIGDDIPRKPECSSANNPGLLQADQGVQRLDDSTQPDSKDIARARPQLDRVPRGAVRSRSGSERWGASGGCGEVLLAASHQGHPKGCERAQGLAAGSPSASTHADSHRGPRGYHGCDDLEWGVRDCPEALHPVPRLHAPRRMQSAASQAAGGPTVEHKSELLLLGDLAAPNRGPYPWKNRNFRWLSDHRFGHLAESPPAQVGDAEDGFRPSVE